MRKTLTILLFLIILLVIIGGVFLWKASKEEKKGSPDDYAIKESNEGKIVENSKAGLKFRVPEGWKVEKIEIDEGSVVLYSPDAESVYSGKIRPPLKKGCMIEVAVLYKRTNPEELEKEIKEMHSDSTIKSDEFELIEFKNTTALRNRFSDEILGEGESFYVINNDKVYSFCIYKKEGSLEVCNKNFNRFLDELSFK